MEVIKIYNSLQPCFIAPGKKSWFFISFSFSASFSSFDSQPCRTLPTALIRLMCHPHLKSGSG
jgi:hypothetical protein